MWNADTPLVGREGDLARLTQMVDDARRGRSGVVLVAGEPGIGKTRLVEEVAEEAQRGDCRVLWGRCWDGEGAPAFWPWVQIIRAHLRDRDPAGLRGDLGSGAAAIAQLVNEVQAQLPETAPLPDAGAGDVAALPADPAQARFLLFDSIAFFLRNVSRDQPLVIVLDDLHAADVPSLLLLQFLAHSLTAGLGSAEASRVLVVGAYRDTDVSRGHPLAQALGELLREPIVRRLDLSGLKEEAVARCIAGIAGRTPPASVTAAITRGTNGNPFFVTEVARLLASADATTEGMSMPPAAGGRDPAAPQPGGSAWPFGIPPTVRAVIARRLDRLSAMCNEAVATAAVFGNEFNVATLRDVWETGGGPLLDALEEAESARIIVARSGAPGWYDFTHALIREVLYEGLPAARRIRLHERVGLALEARYGPDAAEHFAELAHHFVQAAPGGGVERAVGYARCAGDRALTLLAHEEAVRLYRMALATQQASGVVDERSCAELSLALGDALARAGDSDAARAAYQQAIEGVRRLSRGEADEPAALLAHAALGISMSADTGRYDPALFALLEKASAALPVKDSALRARVLARLAVALIPAAGAEERRAALAEEAVAMARRVGDKLALAAALLAWLLAAWRPENTTERLEKATQIARLAEEAKDGGLAFRGRGRRLTALLELGDIAAADLELEACDRLAEELRQPYYHWSAGVMRAMRALLAGRLDEAERLVQGALATGTRAQASDAFAAFAVQLFALRRDQGRLAELVPLVSGFVARLPDLALVRSYVALLYAEVGRHDEAREELERLAVDDFAGIPRDEVWLVTLVNLAEVCTILGHNDRTAVLLELLRPLAGRAVVVGLALGFVGAVSHYLGLLAATLGRWEEADEHFAGALALHVRIGARPHAARTAAAYAAMLVARAETEATARKRDGATASCIRRARVLLAEARAIARELGMAGVLAECDRLLARIEGAAPGIAAPVAMRPEPSSSLIAAGLTAREAEVLRLVASGASNREIADELVVSVRTVERHLLHVYGKIGARRRADAVVYAHRQGLA